MYYGHAPRRGRRRPAYEWVPSFFPRRRRKRRPLPTGFGPAPRRSRTNPRGLPPREPLPPFHPEDDLMRHPKLSLVPGSIGEGLVEMFAGAALTAVWLFWEYFLAAGLAIWALRFLVRHIRKHEKEYVYNCEQAYCDDRVNRKISVNPPPTAAALEAVWAATRGGRRGDPAVLAARLQLGSMLSDLEPVVDQSYIRDETGAIVGRQPGLRGWIGFYTPSLLPHYKSLMAYKALADKLRLALRIEDPDTLDNVLELGQQPESIKSKNSKKLGENGIDMGEVGTPKDAQGIEREALEDAGITQGTARVAGKTQVNGAGNVRFSSNSMQLKTAIRVLKSNVEDIRKAHHELFGAGMPGTMAALEVAVRERLGLAWMRRGRRKAKPAA